MNSKQSAVDDKSVKQIKQHQNITLGGYLAMPHELLHIAGYKLVGRSCQYRWGDFHVKPQGEMTISQRLVGLLFPFIMFSLVCFVTSVLSGFAYRYGLDHGYFLWFIILTIVALMSGAYAGTAIGDLRQAYLLITGKALYSWTPFDIFFWPVVNWSEVRGKLTAEQQNDKQD